MAGDDRQRLLDARVNDVGRERITVFSATGRYLSKYLSSAVLIDGPDLQYTV